ncbi:MAG TPA: hypothetical protein VGM80_06030 [Gaiellaceae bacterium]
MTLWEIVLTLVLLKIPVAYVGWVIWCAIKAEPEFGTTGGTDSMNWTPWRPTPRDAMRPGPRRTPDRGRPRDTRRRERVGGMRV